MGSIRILLFGLISTGLFILLAVIGEGGIDRFFSIGQLTCLVVVSVVLVIVAAFSSGSVSPGIREDRSNRWVFVAFGLVGVLTGWLPAFDDRHNILTFGSSGVRWIGVALFAVGGLIRLIPVFQLGKRFSGLVAIQPGHELATDGAYRIIRHPSYLGMILTVLGWALAFRSGLGLILTGLMLVPIIGRIKAEEALLLDHFGEQYVRYRDTTWRLIPFVY
jgi:protein-S-isoprenylcysteine O-methyltransferase Ste14